MKRKKFDKEHNQKYYELIKIKCRWIRLGENLHLSTLKASRVSNDIAKSHGIKEPDFDEVQQSIKGLEINK